MTATINVRHCATAVVVACCVAPAYPADADSLYARFELAPHGAWARVSISLHPSAWRVGTPDGPVTTAGQLRAVLATARSLSIGARCAGWVHGPTLYPCGVAVEVPGTHGGTPAFGARAIGWKVSDIKLVAPTLAPDAARDGAGLIAPLPDVAQFVAVRVPAAVLAPAGRTSLKFRIRALSNPLVPSTFVRASGVVVVRSATSDAIDD